MSFYTAARDGQIELLRELLDGGGDVNERFNDDRTAIHFASDGGHVEVVSLLLSKGAKVNDADSFNHDTPLHLATEGGYTEVVSLLLSYGADPNTQDRMNGETPLHLACEGGHSEIVSLLLCNGARTDIKNVYGKVAAHYATGQATRGEFDKFEQLRSGGIAPHGAEPPPPADAVAAAPPAQRPAAPPGAAHGLEEGLREAVAALAAGGAPILPSSVVYYDQATASRIHEGQRPFERVAANGRLDANGRLGGGGFGEGELWGGGGREAGGPGKRGKAWYGSWSSAGVSTSGERKENQDGFCALPTVGGDPGISMFGVFDGHGSRGDSASGLVKHAAEGMINVAAVRRAQEALEGDARVQAISQELVDMFVKLQSLLSVQNDFDVQASGCTAIVALCIDSDVYIANAGDSRAVLAHAIAGEAKSEGDERERLHVTQVSTDHVPSIRAERARIESMGGLVRREGDPLTGEHGPYRVWRKDGQGPGLAMSRSLGDLYAHKVGVTCTPEVRYLPHRPSDRFLLMASDGVWDMLSNSEAVDIAARGGEDCRGDPHTACKQVCETARRAWEFKETRIDDITCLIVFLPLPSLLAEPAYPAPPFPAPPSVAPASHVSNALSEPSPSMQPHTIAPPLPRGSLPPATRATPTHQNAAQQKPSPLCARSTFTPVGIASPEPSAGAYNSRSSSAGAYNSRSSSPGGFNNRPPSPGVYRLPSPVGAANRGANPSVGQLQNPSPHMRLVGPGAAEPANTSALAEWTGQQQGGQAEGSVRFAGRKEPLGVRALPEQGRGGGSNADPLATLFEPFVGGGQRRRNSEGADGKAEDCVIM